MTRTTAPLEPAAPAPARTPAPFGATASAEPIASHRDQALRRAEHVYSASDGGFGAGRSARWGPAAVDLVCLGAALLLALTPLLPVYGTRAAAPAVVGGVLLGTAVGAAGARRGWTALGVVAALVVTYLLAGGALAAPGSTVARVLPGLDTPVALARGAASAWKQVLTLQPPVGAGGTVLVAALLLALVGSAVAASVTLRTARPGVAALAATVPLVVGVGAALLGTRTPPVPPVVEGTTLAVLLGGWAAWRTGRLQARRVLATALVGAAAVGAGLLGAPVVTADEPRFVLRDVLVPPFDPDDYPSPLAAFRSYVKLDDTVLFTVSGLPEGARIRLATFDRYDGVVWNVAGTGSAAASGEFRRVGDHLEAPVPGDSATVEVEVAGLTGPWLPTVGEATRIAVDDADAATGLRFNDATGSAVLVGGLAPGLRYSLDVVVPPAPSTEGLGATPVQAVSQPTLAGVPASVRSLAPEVAREAGRPAEVVEALASWLVDHGYFSHGQSGEHPCLSGHGADRLARFLGDEVMVGDGEQYAATLALLLREMGLPARVVLGFDPRSQSGAGSGSSGDEPAPAGTVIEVTGADVSAWVEVPFVGYGWVPFDATPPESKTVDEDPDPQPSEPKPQVVQPPPPADAAVSPPDEDTAQPSTRPDDEQAAATPAWLTVLARVGMGAGGLVVLSAPLLTIAALKVARRRRRRGVEDPVLGVAGGWDEVMDAARDLRRPPGHGTRREAAHRIGRAFGDAGDVIGVRLDGLARRADRAVFAPGAPGENEVAGYWADVDDALAAMRSAVPGRARWRAAVSTASLVGRVAGGGGAGGIVPLVRSTLLLARRGGAH